MESPSNSRNTASAAWRTFLSLLEYKCERAGTHFVAVTPKGTTKACAAFGVSTEKPLWVREHSCPSRGFTADRDWNAVVRLRLTGSKIVCDFATAWNILSRGAKQVGEGRSEPTPVKTALPTGTTTVPAKRVVEAGNPTLKERAASAASE